MALSLHVTPLAKVCTGVYASADGRWVLRRMSSESRWWVIRPAVEDVSDCEAFLDHYGLADVAWGTLDAAFGSLYEALMAERAYENTRFFADDDSGGGALAGLLDAAGGRHG